MTKAKGIVKKVEVLNIGNSRPAQWDGKKGNSYIMWKIKYQACMVMLGLDKALSTDFACKLPAKMKDFFDLTTEQGQKWANTVKKNKKAMMQFAHSFQKKGPTNQTQLLSESR